MILGLPMLRWLGVVAALVTVSCALPARLGGKSDGPTPLPPELMQAGQQIEYRAPARDQVVGCVVVTYDIARDGVPSNVQIQESHPAGYFDAEVLNLMKAIRFRDRKRAERGARLFSFVPPNSGNSREAAASLCSPVPTHEELNRSTKENP